ncbi:Uncharacterised protein g8457 [Pycnogonum litorale]
MFKILVLCIVAAIAVAKPAPQDQEVYEYSPYEYSYAVEDEQGNKNEHSQKGDGSGVVTGEFYLYDAYYQTYRRVRYESSPGTGIRFFIESNEPGVGPENPADVEITREEPPADVYTKQWQGSRR